MKENVQIRKTLKTLLFLLEKTDDKFKMGLYWGLLEECMDKSCDNVNWVGAQWTRFLKGKIDILEKRRDENTQKNRVKC